jgi:hypothetical protein
LEILYALLLLVLGGHPFPTGESHDQGDNVKEYYY